MRKKNRKTCFPFKSPGNDDVDLVDYLPPLSVPEFRCWQCSSCTSNDETKRSSEEMSALALDDASTSSCGNVRGQKDGLFIHSRENTGTAETRYSIGNLLCCILTIFPGNKLLLLKINADGEGNKDRTKCKRTQNLCVTGRHKDISCKF